MTGGSPTTPNLIRNEERTMNSYDDRSLNSLLHDHDWSVDALDEVLSDEEVALLSLDLDAIANRRRERTVVTSRRFTASTPVPESLPAAAA